MNLTAYSIGIISSLFFLLSGLIGTIVTGAMYINDLEHRISNLESFVEWRIEALDVPRLPQPQPPPIINEKE
jgi:hypothetical protein